MNQQKNRKMPEVALKSDEKTRMFHVSRAESTLDRFALLTHFGTLRAAEQRAGSVAMAGAQLTLYEVDVSIGNALRMHDLVDDVRGNSHNWVRLADVLHYDEKVISANDRDSIFAAGVHGTQPAAMRLAEILRSKGFDSIVYENRFEDVGSSSVIILDESQVSIVGASKLLEVPSEGEFQSFRYDDETESGFIIRNEGGGRFKAEDWRDGDIVENAYGTYAEMKAWTEVEAARKDLASLFSLGGAGVEPVFQRNLAGYAAQAAAKELFENWDDALRNDSSGKIVGNLLGDVDATVAALMTFRARVSAALPARYQTFVCAGARCLIDQP
ncbi:TPA: hypothetical protein ACYLN4_001094 [Burkholderia lata]